MALLCDACGKLINAEEHGYVKFALPNVEEDGKTIKGWTPPLDVCIQCMVPVRAVILQIHQKIAKEIIPNEETDTGTCTDSDGDGE